jgi:TPR repeat protein
MEGKQIFEHPFCRQLTQSREQADANTRRRVKANDPVAMREMGMSLCDEEDFEAAIEYWTKAAGLGDIEAHYQLSDLYNDGLSVEADIKMEVYHLEEAAIGGHSIARHDLGVVELNFGRKERAAKHFIIAANVGNKESIKELMKLYTTGVVTKEDSLDC